MVQGFLTGTAGQISDLMVIVTATDTEFLAATVSYTYRIQIAYLYGTLEGYNLTGVDTVTRSRPAPSPLIIESNTVYAGSLSSLQFDGSTTQVIILGDYPSYSYDSFTVQVWYKCFSFSQLYYPMYTGGTLFASIVGIDAGGVFEFAHTATQLGFQYFDSCAQQFIQVSSNTFPSTMGTWVFRYFSLR